MKMTRFETIRCTAWQAGVIRAALLFSIALGGCTPLGEEGSSVSRGDQAFAKRDLEEALAEYRLALRQGATEPEVYARIAHTFIGLGRVDEAREYYRLAVSEDSSMADQAVGDFVRLAREEEQARDRFGMASAVQTALEFRPGISLEDLSLPLAEHYSDIGEYGRALPFYQKALSALDPDSVPRILFATAIAYDEVGDCESAVVYYEEYRDRLPRWPTPARSEVDWRLGNCSYQLALDRREEGDDEEALRHLETLTRIGEPKRHLASGYLEMGEILGYRGECEAAVEAFQLVALQDPSGTGPLVDRAAERIDQIRFGGQYDLRLGLFQGRRVTGSCFPPESDEESGRTKRGRGG